MLTPLGTKEDDEQQQHQSPPTAYFYPPVSQHYYCPVPYPTDSYHYYSPQINEEELNHSGGSSSYYTTNYHQHHHHHRLYSHEDEPFYPQKNQTIPPVYDYNTCPMSSSYIQTSSMEQNNSLQQNSNDYPSPYVSEQILSKRYVEIFSLVTIEWSFTFGCNYC